MNIALERLIEGIIATLRSDVIPHVADPYARGQTIGVIDLLNNIGPRVEWAQAPLAANVRAKRQLLADVGALVPGAVTLPEERAGTSAADLLAARATLDAEIGDTIARLWERRDEGPTAEAMGLIRAHMHDETRAEMKKTRKPLFAEIASGGGAG